MKFPKLVIASDGYSTGILLDGIFIGQGIERIDFSAESKDGELKSTIRIMDLNVKYAKLSTDTERFARVMESMAEGEDRRQELVAQAMDNLAAETQDGR